MTNMKGRSALVLVALLTVGVSVFAFQAPKTKDPAIGTWTLNVEKSKFSPGPPAKSGKVTFEAAGEGVRVVADIVDGQGVESHTEYTANYDGKDVPIKGSPVSDTVSVKKIDENTFQRTDKKGGKVVQTYTRKVAADGKTMTVNQTGTDAQGQKVKNVMVFERK